MTPSAFARDLGMVQVTPKMAVTSSKRNEMQILAPHLCSGCGVCTFISNSKYVMTDVEIEGRRPVYAGEVVDTALLKEVRLACPGLGLKHASLETDGSVLPDLFSAWGPVLAVYEGHACDSDLRFAGSSGGAVSAIALFCLERQAMHGVLHTSFRPEAPHMNRTVFSKCRTDILEACGSRYSPASPCDSLQTIVDASGKCVFIGKPCDVAAVSKARTLRPELDKKVGLCVAFFCAGTPSSRGTLEMLDAMGVGKEDTLMSLRYRGNGWPGCATAVYSHQGEERVAQMSYEDSWGKILAKHQQWRCKVCADHSGEFADISIGDPWYRAVQQGEVGDSLIVVRSELGRQTVELAAEAGYISVRKVDPLLLPASQPNLLKTRGAVWGRILASRIMGIGAPQYINMPLFTHWWQELSFKEKLRSILGTLFRIARGRHTPKN